MSIFKLSIHLSNLKLKLCSIRDENEERRNKNKKDKLLFLSFPSPIKHNSLVKSDK